MSVIKDCVCRFTTQSNEFVKDYGSIFKDAKVLLVKEKEGEDNQHYHAYVEGLKKATLDTRIKKYFTGNKLYSCKVVQNVELQKRYLLKGTEESKPVVILNTLGVDVEEGWRMYWSDRMNYMIEKKERKEKGSVVDVVYQRLHAREGKRSELYSTRTIFYEIIDYCVEIEKLIPGDYLMMQYIETIKVKGLGPMSMESKLERIVDKMSVRSY